MGRDELGPAERFVEDFGGLKGNKVVACSMKPVFTDPILFVILVWNRVMECIRGKGLMECGVKNCDLWFSGKQLCGNFNALCGCWIVQGRQYTQFLDTPQDFLCHHSRFVEVFPAVNHTMADSLDIERGGLSEDSDHSQKSDPMVGMLHHLPVFISLKVDDLQAGMFGSQALSDSGSKHLFRLRIQNGEF